MDEQPSGYPFKVTGHAVDDCYCSICLLLMKDVVELPCTHCFCTECIKHNENQGREICCPECRKEYRPEDKRKNIAVDRIIKSMDVKCLQEDKGCKWSGCAGDYQDHIKFTCPNVEIACPNNGCQFSCERNKMEKHSMDCPYRHINCRHCDVQVQKVKEEEHLEVCPLLPVKCTNQYCDEEMPRNQVDKHRKEACCYETTLCIYKKIGCDVEFFRKDKEKHLSDSIHSHMLMMMENQTKLAEKNQELEVKVEKMSKQIELNENTIRDLTKEKDEMLEKLTVSEKSNEKTTESIVKVESSLNEVRTTHTIDFRRVEKLERFSYVIAKLQGLFAYHWQDILKPRFSRLSEDGYSSDNVIKEWNSYLEDVGEFQLPDDSGTHLMKEMLDSYHLINPPEYSKRFIQIIMSMEPNVKYRSGPYRFFKIYISSNPSFFWVSWYSSRYEYANNTKACDQKSDIVSVHYIGNAVHISLYPRVEYKECFMLSKNNENDMIRFENNLKYEISDIQNYKFMDFILLKL